MKPLLLCILDGVGIREDEYGNAYKLANTPFLDSLFNKYPHSRLEASSTYVGLPLGQMGNSEVGHSNIGAGRVVYQSIEYINNQINSNEIYQNKTILELFEYVRKNNQKLHLMGLVSDGGVHSSMEHIQALLKMCKENHVYVYFHVITDGRDTLTKSSLQYITKIEEWLHGVGSIASISGRYYAMDRDNNYDRIQKAYDVYVGNSSKLYNNIREAIEENYNQDITDEFILPGLIDQEGIIEQNDGVLFFNFRPDRLREMGSTLTNSNFTGFSRKSLNIKLVTMMPISDEAISHSAFDLGKLSNTLGEYIANKGLKQLRIAETEKYAHVTYFFDGGKELELENCKRILIPSPKVATYDLKPEMSALEITDTLLKEMDHFDVIILNFANGDMVGHTGNLEAAMKAVETLDDCVKKIYDEIEKLNGTVIITADHGNCEEMIDKDGNILTSHTTNKVPFLINKELKLKDGKLADIAPTMLSLLNLDIPEEMTGEILIED